MFVFVNVFLCLLLFLVCFTFFQNKQEELDPQESLHKIVMSVEGIDDYSGLVPELKLSVLEHISEFQMELETR